jgi:hypothetical protein
MEQRRTDKDTNQSNSNGTVQEPQPEPTQKPNGQNNIQKPDNSSTQPQQQRLPKRSTEIV